LFMQAFAEEVLSRDTLTSPSKMNSLVDETTPYVALDDDFGATDMLGLGRSMSAVRSSDITSFTVPTAGIGTEGGGQSVVYVDWDELDEVQQRFKDDDLADYQPEPYQAWVLHSKESFGTLRRFNAMCTVVGNTAQHEVGNGTRTSLPN